MLNHPTIDQLHQLGLAGMARGFTELEANPQSAELSHAEWLGLLLDREATERYERRLRARLRFARLRHQAVVEDVDYRAARGLDRTLFQALIGGRWIDEAQNLIIEGPAGVGKSWLACALGHKACRDNRSVLYQRIPRLFGDLALARGDGRYPRLMRALGGVKLLILDDWGLEPLGPEQRHDMLEIVEDRYGRGATLITSQIPVDRWHDLIGTSPKRQRTDRDWRKRSNRHKERNDRAPGPWVSRISSVSVKGTREHRSSIAQGVSGRFQCRTERPPLSWPLRSALRSVQLPSSRRWSPRGRCGQS